MDLIISNCVVNLSPDKTRVIREAFRVLRPGGEMYFSDVYADRRVPAALQKDEVRGGFTCSTGHPAVTSSVHVPTRVCWQQSRRTRCHCKHKVRHGCNCLMRSSDTHADWRQFVALQRGMAEDRCWVGLVFTKNWDCELAAQNVGVHPRKQSEGVRRLSSAVQVIWGECIAGALYINDFLRIAKEAGFADPRILHQGPVAINDPEIQVTMLPKSCDPGTPECSAAWARLPCVQLFRGCHRRQSSD